MIQFPETAANEWQIVADAANEEVRLRQKIQHDTAVEAELKKIRQRHEAQQLFLAELDAASTPTLEMSTLDSYRRDKAAGLATGPGDLIEGVLKDRGLCIALGPSGAGKSTLALQMLDSLMRGVPWLGQPAQKINGAVGIISYDMDGGLVLDWMDGFPNVDPTRLHVVNAHKRGNPLGVPTMRAQIASAWRAAQIEVVVIDSFSASFFGRDENDAAATQHHYRDLSLFAMTEVGARAVIIVTHSTDGSPTKPRGSTVHQDVADSIVAVWQPAKAKGDPSRYVDMTKYRQHRDPVTGNMTHQMSPLVLTEPDPITHLVGVDPGGMTLAGMSTSHIGAAAFTDMPDTHEDPDTSSDSGLDDDL